MTTVLVYCDRCHKQVRDAYRSHDTTAGFYDVVPGLHGKNHWSRFAREGERNICDACMWADRKYIEAYGHQAVRKP